MAGGDGIADENDQRARQLVALVMALEQAADGFPAGNLVAVLNDGNHQRTPAPALEVDQRRAVQLPVQGRGRTLEQALGHVAAAPHTRPPVPRSVDERLVLGVGDRVLGDPVAILDFAAFLVLAIEKGGGPLLKEMDDIEKNMNG